jgi:hypothetical protein
MYPTPEHLIQAEVDYRRERIRSQFAASAQRRARRQARQMPAARHTVAHRAARLVTGS